MTLVSFSLYSCTADSVDDTKNQSEVIPSNPQTPTDVTAEEVIAKPKI